jgi:hypothetical protein
MLEGSIRSQPCCMMAVAVLQPYTWTARRYTLGAQAGTLALSHPLHRYHGS